MGADFGNTALHSLVSGIHAGHETSAQLQIVAMILCHPTTDACIYNGLGATPYMSVSSLHHKLAQVLHPTVTWTKIELVLEVHDDLDTLALALADLVDKVADLRLPDLLFSKNDAPERELERRRLILWERLLSPLTLKLCPTRKLTQKEKNVFQYCWSASQGPPLSIRQVRSVC